MKQWDELEAPLELYQWMKEHIRYGWLDNNKITHFSLSHEMGGFFYIQKPSELVKSQIGVCVDQVELERDFLEKRGYHCESYCLHMNREFKLRAHFFLIFQEGKMWYWIENAYKTKSCLISFPTKKQALACFPQSFIEEYQISSNDFLYLTPYQKLNFGNSKQIERIIMSA